MPRSLQPRRPPSASSAPACRTSTPDADPASDAALRAREPEIGEPVSGAARDDFAESPVATAPPIRQVDPDRPAQPRPLEPDASETPASAPSDEPAPPLAVAAATAGAPAAAAPEPVRVHVNARPWARISVDGEEIGVTPLGNVPLEPGVRRFRAELADGRIIEREVTISTASRRITFP